MYEATDNHWEFDVWLYVLKVLNTLEYEVIKKNRFPE